MTKPRVSQNKHDQVYIQNFIVSTLTLMNKVKTRKAKAGGGGRYWCLCQAFTNLPWWLCVVLPKVDYFMSLSHRHW